MIHTMPPKAGPLVVCTPIVKVWTVRWSGHKPQLSHGEEPGAVAMTTDT